MNREDISSKYFLYSNLITNNCLTGISNCRLHRLEFRSQAEYLILALVRLSTPSWPVKNEDDMLSRHKWIAIQ